MSKIAAGDAMMKVLEDWGVQRIYGLPGGSLDSTMNAIHNFRDRIHYVGVRHEEAGALAAVAEAKLTGRLAVALGSAGPGAVHLLNGLYDAKTDGTPVLAIIGQVPSSRMNLDFFQELDEGPIFADVAVYNRTVMTAEQLPVVIDKAIATAYEKRGVAVVIIPKDFAWEEIEDGYISAAHNFVDDAGYPRFPGIPWEAPESEVKRVADLLIGAKRPLIYFGQGAKGAAEALRELSDTLHIPLGSTYLAKDILEGDEPAWMLSTGRVATKPGVDVAKAADTVLFVGTNFEFPMFHPNATFIDVNLRPTVIGQRHVATIGIMADAPTFLEQLGREIRSRGAAAADTATANHAGWYNANVENRKLWDEWIAAKAQGEREVSPARYEAVFEAINAHAKKDAIFGVDVGNVNIATGRFLDLDHDKRFVTSPLYATMGFGLPSALAAALAYPGRQVWNLAGDGGFAMMSQDLVTQAEQQAPVINVVFTNESLGFIEAEQDDTNQPHSGVALSDVDFAKVAAGFGVKGFTARNAVEFAQILDQVADTTEPVLIDVKITNDRLLPVEKIPTSAADFPGGEGAFREFMQSYDAGNLPALGELLEKHHG